MSNLYDRAIIDLVCQFCGQRCFVPLTTQAPEKIASAFLGRGVNVMATCPGGQAFDKSLLSYSWGDVLIEVWDYAIDQTTILEKGAKVWGVGLEKNKGRQLPPLSYID